MYSCDPNPDSSSQGQVTSNKLAIGFDARLRSPATPLGLCTVDIRAFPLAIQLCYLTPHPTPTPPPPDLVDVSRARTYQPHESKGRNERKPTIPAVRVLSMARHVWTETPHGTVASVGKYCTVRCMCPIVPLQAKHEVSCQLRSTVWEVRR
jgi:hypothetical protein